MESFYNNIWDFILTMYGKIFTLMEVLCSEVSHKLFPTVRQDSSLRKVFESNKFVNITYEKHKFPE